MNRRKVIAAALLLTGVFGLAPAAAAHGYAAKARQPLVAARLKAKVGSFPVTLRDDAGHLVTVPKQPHHIASVTEGTDEILSALVPKRDIAMVTLTASNPAYSNITSFVKGIPAIGQADAERILSVHPDLVLLASYTKPGVVNQIEQSHVPAYEFSDFTSIADIERNIQVVGKLVGQPAKAKALVARMNQQLRQIQDAIKKVSRGKRKPTVLDYSSWGYAAGSGTTVNDIIVRAGGINAAAKLKGWQKVTDEEIVRLNPDVIIDASDDKGFVAKILNDPGLSSVNAVKNGRVYYVKGADLSSVSQYIVNAVRDVAHLLYPSARLPRA